MRVSYLAVDWVVVVRPGSWLTTWTRVAAVDPAAGIDRAHEVGAIRIRELHRSALRPELVELTFECG
jgi:acyl dehydratase